MRILNCLNKENIKINNNKTINRNNSKRGGKKIYKSYKKNEKVLFDKNIIKQKQNGLFVEKKESYQKYKIKIDIKDKSLKKDEPIHKRTYDINKNQKIKKIKENISQRNKGEEILVEVNHNDYQKNKDIFNSKKQQINIKN